jgi:hypothetical protein
MILSPRRVQGLKASPARNKKYDLISEKGPGVFVSAIVTKQGGSTDISQVALYIDGKNVVAITYAGADTFGLDVQNNFGVKLVKGSVDAISIQFNEPLHYKKEMRIEFSVGTDIGIAQVLAVAVVGDNCSYPG